jgi:hypothetical protein
MRPTDLHFRSPREKTAEFLYPLLTFDGRQLLLPKRSPNKKGSFAHAHRFVEYSDLARKTGYRVGPGAYDTAQSAIGRAAIRGTPSYHKVHGEKDYSNNAYIYVGNSVVFDPGLMKKTTSQLNSLNLTVDPSEIAQKTPQNKSRKEIGEKSEGGKQPWFMKYHRSMSEEQSARLSASFYTDRARKTEGRTWKQSPKFE